MIKTAIDSNLKHTLYQLIDELSDEKIMSLYHFASYLVYLENQEGMEGQTALGSIENTTRA